MQVRVDEKVAQCLGYLRSPEFAPLVEYLRAERQGTLEMMAAVADTEKIYRLQGIAGCLGDLISLVENADALIAKMKANRKIG